jgi:sulfate adenylyltransferase subunit 1
MDVLRIATSGSVDDGKSTLIGRLLYETKQVPQDKMENARQVSERQGLDFTDLSLLTDGLLSEREQGITIDVAHVYFATSKRKYIIADTPGHEEYTRNMVTGASQSDAAIILIDARKGILPQTRRHLAIASMLRLHSIVVAINKMDLVGYDQQTFETHKAEVLKAVDEIECSARIRILPISALEGDGVTTWLGNMPWHSGPCLLESLEMIESKNWEEQPTRFMVQTVIRPKSGEFKDYRAYAGSLLSGTVKVGDDIINTRTGQKAAVLKLEKWGHELSRSGVDKALTVHLNKDIDVNRGDLLVPAEHDAKVGREVVAKVCWMTQEPLHKRQKLLMSQGVNTVRVVVEDIVSVVNPEDSTLTEKDHLDLNDISTIKLLTSAPLPREPYTGQGEQGGIILIDPLGHHTVGAGVIC